VPEHPSNILAQQLLVGLYKQKENGCFGVENEMRRGAVYICFKEDSRATYRGKE